MLYVYVVSWEMLIEKVAICVCSIMRNVDLKGKKLEKCAKCVSRRWKTIKIMLNVYVVGERVSKSR